MKKSNHSKIVMNGKIFICTLLMIIITVNLFFVAVAGYTGKKNYPAPSIYTKLKHGELENEIDKAILASIEVAKSEAPSVYSSTSPRSSDAILSTMGNLPVSSYPELWKRICKEPAYRPQKIVAMELFLGVPFGEVGLYDAWGQKEWYRLFTEMKSNLPADNITQEDVELYGKLLLPDLCRKLKKNKLVDSEQQILNEMMNEISMMSETDSYSDKTVNTVEDAAQWLSEHKELIDVLNKIIKKEYEWIE